MTNGLIQHITVEESTSIQWVSFHCSFYKKKALQKVNSFQCNECENFMNVRVSAFSTLIFNLGIFFYSEDTLSYRLLQLSLK